MSKRVVVADGALRKLAKEVLEDWADKVYGDFETGQLMFRLHLVLAGTETNKQEADRLTELMEEVLLKAREQP